jgi:hypothetical protein
MVGLVGARSPLFGPNLAENTFLLGLFHIEIISYLIGNMLCYIRYVASRLDCNYEKILPQINIQDISLPMGWIILNNAFCDITYVDCFITT